MAGETSITPEEASNKTTVSLEVLTILMRLVNLDSFWSNAALRRMPFDHLDLRMLFLVFDVKKLPEKSFLHVVGEPKAKVAARLKKLKEHQLITIQSDEKKKSD